MAMQDRILSLRQCLAPCYRCEGPQQQPSVKVSFRTSLLPTFSIFLHNSIIHSESRSPGTNSSPTKMPLICTPIFGGIQGTSTGSVCLPQHELLTWSAANIFINNFKRFKDEVYILIDIIYLLLHFIAD